MSCLIQRVLLFNNLVNLGEIHVFDSVQEITNTCMYSWSNDMTCWTNWVDYNTYKTIGKNVEEDVYLRVLLFGDFSKISLNGLFTNCYSICIYQENPFLIDFCGNENLFNPLQGLDCALQLQQQLSDSIICMFGIPIFYFRVKPDHITADYTFKEYILHDVIDVKKTRLMIPDGQMPSSNPKFSALDFDWEVDWNVEMSKTDFAVAFGDTAYPKQRDFIYIPIMNRMWSVNAAYDEKNEGLLWRPTTWKLSLIKYEDATNIEIPDSMDELIDGWLVNRYDDVFGEKETNEQIRLSGIDQVSSPSYTPTNLYDISMEDATRRKYSRGEVSVIDYQYNHHSNIVARSIYKFKSPDSTILYQNGYCGEEGVLSFILQTQGLTTDNRDIISFGPIKVKMLYESKTNGDTEDMYKLQFNDMTVDIKPFSTNLVILRWSRSTYTVSMEVYEYIYQLNVPKYMLKPEMYWFKETPIFSQTTTYNNDYVCEKPEDCYIQPYPCMITNIKLYNKDLGQVGSIKESIKYTTQHQSCIINDVARHFNSEHGYTVK